MPHLGEPDRNGCQSPLRQPRRNVPIGARSACRRRGLLALLLSLPAITLWGAFGANAAAQTQTAQLETSVVAEGETAVLRITNAPDASEHFLHLQPFQDPYTASASDVELYGADDVVVSPGAAAPVTRQGDGTVEFSVAARADSEVDGGETFGIRLCVSETDCSGEALLGEWIIEIVEPATEPGVDQGLIPETELDGPPLGEPTGPVSVTDYLGPDGVYRLRDGGGELELRLLSSSGGSDALVDGVDLEALGASAGAAYAPAVSGDGLNGTETTTPATWLAASNGQLFLLVGGVNVFFASHLDESEIIAILARHGVPGDRTEPLGELPNAYLIRTVSDHETLQLADALAAESGVDSAVPNFYTPLARGPEQQPNSYPGSTRGAQSRCRSHKQYPDALSGCLWHLDAGTAYRYYGRNPSIDINLGDVWATTMGAGVTVALIDATWEAEHPDLRDNVDTTRSHHWGGHTGEDLTRESPYHGTAVAGVVAARDNSIGGRGVAPRATVVNYNYLDAQSTAHELTALTLNKATVAVYNMSYGFGDVARIMRRGEGWRRAVEEGLREGFGGKGSSYVKAAGNGAGRPGGDWATLEEENNHRGVIAVCAVNIYGVSTAYSEDGPSLWICAPSNDSRGASPGILTTIGKTDYTDRFGGTSAAAPIVSGVIALMRSANADLTWRDVKIILANTAQQNDATHTGWVTGANKYGSSTEKYSFNYEYGFGTVDAAAAVQAASNWTLLPAELSTEVSSSTAVSLPRNGHEIELTADVTTDIDFVEHVTIAIEADIYDMRDYRWTLVSPSGTESLLSPQHVGSGCVDTGCSWTGTMHFGSSKHLGEAGSGAWKIKVRRHMPDLTVCDNGYWFYNSLCRDLRKYDQQIESFKLVVFGHKTESGQAVRLAADPLSVTEGGEVSLDVRVDGAAPTTDLVLPLRFTDIDTTPPGAAGADYAALASITIPAGATSATANLATTQDTVYEGDETFTVGLGAMPSGFKRDGVPVTVTIADDDPLPVVTLKSSSATVTEGDSVSITAGLSNPSAEAVTLDVGAAPVAPAVAGDGALSATTALTIEAGATDSTGTVTFAASDDDLYQLSTATAKKFTISATAGGGRGVADPASITVTIDDDESKPEVTIAAGAGVTEGSDATFTLTATPKPAGDLAVNVAVTVSGDYGVAAGARTVTIPTSGTATLTLATTGDLVDEPDGSITVTIGAGADYTPSSTATATVDVADDDDSTGYTVDPDVVAKVQALAGETQHGTSHVNRWNRVLVAFGEHDGTGVTGGGMTAAQAQQMADAHSSPVWDEVVVELTALEATPPPPTPEVSIAAGSGVTEGGNATFTLTASPVPTADLDVTVTISAGGDYGVTAGQRTVTIPTSGSKTLTIPTTDDQTDEADGSVTATLVDGAGYDLGTSKSATVTVSDDDDPPTPVVSIAAGGSVTEGAGATFTLTANPAPAANLSVSLIIGKSGDFGVASGFRTVTIPASGSFTLTITSTDDSTDEPDGFVSATVRDGAAYDVGTSSTARVTILDDDDPPGYTVDPTVITEVRALAAQTQHGTSHVNRWNRVLVAFGEHDGTGVTGGAMTAAQAQQMANTHSSPVWDLVVVELTALESSASAVPVVSIAAGSDVTEGGSVSFTLTASPKPAADLDVSVTVATVGDYGVTAGGRTVTIPTSGSETLTIVTTGDQVDEADGSVTATLVDGAAYDLGTSKTATVTVSDDDDPPPQTPVVSISGGSAVTEGGSVSFTLTANPKPAADLDVSVTIAAVGDYGVTAGGRTVTIPTSGSETLTIVTTGDQVDEADGSVTATLVDGAAYDLGTSKTATVTVSDDDDPPPQTPVVSIAAGGSVTEGAGATFTLTANPAPAADLDVTLLIGKSGDFGVASGFRTVTIPTSGSFTLTIPTTGDQTDEADGFVSATVRDGAAYDVGTSDTANVTILDDDDPPPQTPVVSISGGSAVTEGGSVSFTLTASPKPAADLDVTVTVATVGDYGVTPGSRTVTIPASGSKTLTIVTSGDQTDEADGSVTVTLVDGAGYDLGTSKTATVTVSDDDDPPVVVQPVTPALTDCSGLPTLSISSPAAIRGSDTWVEFEVGLSCRPSRSATLLLLVMREGEISGTDAIVSTSLSSSDPSTTVRVQIRDSNELGLALGWSRGLANYQAQGDVVFSD
ncbi:MAG: S8 family serine peptidase [Acidimicrobiaceae bacterium]|nr:S8 family serine peptidase [Acidimicrobiaceae bacterium]